MSPIIYCKSELSSLSVQFISVTQLCPTRCDHMNCSMPGLPVHHQTPRVYSSSCPMSWWCDSTTSSFVVTFSSRLQSFPVSGSFLMSQFFASDGQSIRVSASASVLPMNIQDLISFRIDWFDVFAVCGVGVFSNTILQNHQFFGVQPSLWSNSHIHTWGVVL